MTTLSKRVGPPLTSVELEKIRKTTETLEKQIPFLVCLDEAERKELHPVGDKSREFIRKALVAAQAHPDMLPRSFNVQAFAKSVELSELMYPLRLAVKRFASSIEDTHALALSQAYEAALIVYRATRDNDVDGSLAAARDEMSSRFARKTTKKTPATPPAAPPRT